ncbi:MAG: FtsX-like permease family protein, partial [Bacteroidota bacterium]
HEPIVPLIFRFRRMGQDILLRVKPGTEEQTLAMVEEAYKVLYPKETFEYSFMDASYQNLYVSEQRVAALAKYASILTILISCLGLLGLVTFTAQKRAKEIGIRKVMGASEWKIISLLSTDFTRMVLLAMLIGLPIGYLALNQWLSSFAYKIELDWTYFGLTAIIALLMAWTAVSFQTIKAARLNPVEFLRDE